MTSYVLHKVLVFYVQRTQEVTNDELCLNLIVATRRCRLRRQQQLLEISTKNPGGPYDF